MAVWIDEQGRIVRPQDPIFGNDTFIDFTGIESKPHLDALRRWVTHGSPSLDAGDVQRLLQLPTPEDQLARAEFSLAWHLHQTGRTEAAECHFVRAGELAPYDFTIRRGSMPIRGQDPMGAEFVELYQEWNAAGRPFYVALPVRTE
jgi:hypothetical protein